MSECYTTERQLQSVVLNYLNKLEGCKAYNLHGSAWSGSGRPDIIGVYRSVPFVVELKQVGSVPTKIQEYELCKWRAAGSIAICAYSLTQIMEMIDLIDQKLKNR